MRCLIVTAVDAEAEALASIPDSVVVAGGIGRTNAAAATTEAVLTRGPFDLVISAGIAGMLPGVELELGDILVAEACVYAEEGLLTQDAFLDIQAMGFSLGDFDGNAVPIDPDLLDRLPEAIRIGRIATVATCSGSDLQADLVARRTSAVAEAMEGAAVVHAARRLGVPAIEVRAISNTTGDRDRQHWDIKSALASLADGLPGIISHLDAD